MPYIGKDIVHRGCGLVLDPDVAFRKIDPRARNKVRKAERAGFLVQRKRGTRDELAEFRKLWYQPDDPNFPVELTERDFFFAATLDGEPAGGIILLPVGSHLFMNNLAGNETAKRHGLADFLIWHAVKELSDSGYRYIDVGVSYRPNLYQFFKKWATFHYPVLFKPPALEPIIRFAVFRGIVRVPDVKVDDAKVAAFCLGRPYTIVPDIDHARAIARDRELAAREVPIPLGEMAEVQLLDLTRLFPIQYGALIIGLELSPEQIWDRYGCYDFVKTRYILRFLSSRLCNLEKTLAARHKIRGHYAEWFQNEDVEILEPGPACDAFAFCTDDAEAIARRYREFEVEVSREGGQLSFPCHQGLSREDVDYVYAIYRGYLNLCSEWVPTGVKGTLKRDEDAT